MVNDYNRSPQEVLEELHTSPLGLTAAEAAARLAAHGPNKLKEAEKPSLLRQESRRCSSSWPWCC